MADGVASSAYHVGSISQALSGKKSKKHKVNAENEQLSSLFSGGISYEPVFVPVVPSNKPKKPSDVFKKEDATKKKKRKLESHEKEENGEEDVETDNPKEKSHERSRLSSDDEESQVSRAVKRREGAKKTVEDPERIERSIFVGNLPVTFTHKKLKKLFKIYGEVESVRFRSAALTKPNMSRKIGMIKKEFHKDRHNFNGYVVFKEKDSATKALTSNGQEVDGLHIRVDLVGNTKQHDHRRSVFIGNLPFDTEEESLRQVFSSCGDVEAVRLVRDSVTGTGKGFGFILFKNKDAVTFALKLNKTEFKGRSLRVFPSSENPCVESAQIKKLKKGRPVSYSFSGLMASKKDRGKHTKHRNKQASVQAKQKRNPSSGKEWKANKRQQHSDKKPRHNKNNGNSRPRHLTQFTGTKTSNRKSKHGQKQGK